MHRRGWRVGRRTLAGWTAFCSEGWKSLNCSGVEGRFGRLGRAEAGGKEGENDIDVRVKYLEVFWSLWSRLSTWGWES